MLRNLINPKIFAKISRNVKSRHYSELLVKKTGNKTKKLIPENKIKTNFPQIKIRSRKSKPSKKLGKSLVEMVVNIVALVVLTYIFYPLILLVLFAIISKLYI